MNQTFSLTRLARLNRWFWAIKGRTYLIAAMALLIFIILLLSIVLYNWTSYSMIVQNQNMVWFWLLALLLTGSIASDVFSVLFRQESAITYLMIPASRSEKFWLGIGYCVGAILSLGIVFFSCEAIAFSIVNTHLPTNVPGRYVSSLTYYLAGNAKEPYIMVGLSYTVFAGLAISIIGSFYFRRGVFIRNVGVVLFTLIGLTLLYVGIVALLAGDHAVGTALPFFSIAVHTSINSYENLGPPTWLTVGAYVGTLLMLWTIARVRFNELER